MIRKRGLDRWRSLAVRALGIAVILGVVGPIFGLYRGNEDLLLWLVAGWSIGYSLFRIWRRRRPRARRSARIIWRSAGRGMTATQRRTVRRVLFSWAVGLIGLAIAASAFGLYGHPVVLAGLTVLWSIYCGGRLVLGLVVPIRRLPGMKRGRTILAWWLLSGGEPMRCLISRDAEGLINQLKVPVDPNEIYSKRAIAAYALGILEAESAVPALGGLLERSERWEVRLCAVKALSLIDTPAARRVAVAALRDERWDVRYEAFELVGRLKARDMGPTLATIATSDPLPLARGEACAKLGRIRDERWVETISTVARTDGWSAAHLAVIGLARIATPDAERALTRLVEEGSTRRLRLTARYWRAVSRRAAKRYGPPAYP